MTTQAKPLKPYYDDETLNRIANERRWGRVFGEKSMLDIMSECCDEAQFIETVEGML